MVVLVFRYFVGDSRAVKLVQSATAVMTADVGTVTMLIVLVSLGLVTTTVNVTVMACVVTEKKLHSTPGMYMFSLAVADGIVGLFIIPPMALYSMLGQWPLGHTLCTLWVCVDTACCTSSTIHVLLLAYDRFRALYRPMDYSTSYMKSSYALKRIVLAWMAAICFWWPNIFYYISISQPVENQCLFVPSPDYVLGVSVVAYYMPLLLVVAIYIACVVRLRNRFRLIASARQQEGAATVANAKPRSGGTGTNSTQPIGDLLWTVALERERQRRRRHVHNVLLLGAIIAAYLLCWLPFCIFWPIVAYCPSCIHPSLYYFSYFSAYLNSTINPLLYFAFQRDFRDAFTSMRARICRC